MALDGVNANLPPESRKWVAALEKAIRDLRAENARLANRIRTLEQRR